MRSLRAAIAADGRIGARQSAYNDNLSPPLTWPSVPGAASYAVILEDPDAPGARPFVHWLIWNIPAAATGLPEGLPATGTPGRPVGAVQGVNDAGGVGYFGPKPPSGVHHYTLTLLALDRSVSLPPGANRGALSAAINGHVLAIGTLRGQYAAPGK